MEEFGHFYLDKEKDVIVTLYKTGETLSFVLRTPYHHSGNLIRNLAAVCRMPLYEGADGLMEMRGNVPCYIDGSNSTLYVMRLYDTKVANIDPDGTIERKAYIPAIAKTLMSQAKAVPLDIRKTLVKTYIRKELKFRTDLHSHRSANLSPDLLIALGIHHQLAYPYYYVKKLGLRMTPAQREQAEKRREQAAKQYQGCGLAGKYLDRRIDDHTLINFAQLMLESPENTRFNLPRIRTSLTVMKDGQAVFTNLEKVYLYRYVFAKGMPCAEKIDPSLYPPVEDQDIRQALQQMEQDRLNPAYRNNTLYQDKLLWTARSYQRTGVTYAEISDTALVKESEAAETLRQIHEIMPAVTAQTGVTLRFLAALRRLPLTIVKDQVDRSDYFVKNLQVLQAVAGDPYIAGSDIVGEELNDIRELQPVIAGILRIAEKDPSFVVRIHAGENDSLPGNVLEAIRCVEESLMPFQPFPPMRIGHGLYTAQLHSAKGKQLLQLLTKYGIVLEFQITSNVRLNNLSGLSRHPLRQYLQAGVSCVQGTDGGALYGTDPIDEQLSLERMLSLTEEDFQSMRRAEECVIRQSLAAFATKQAVFSAACTAPDIEAYYKDRIRISIDQPLSLAPMVRRLESRDALAAQIRELPPDRIPIVICGGSFNNAGRRTITREKDRLILENLLAMADPKKVFFVIGDTLSGYEKWIMDHARDRFSVFAFVPACMTPAEAKRLQESELPVRIAIESAALGLYKSIAFEIFKRRQAIIAAFDGNSAAGNLIQEAKNSKYKSRTFISAHSRTLSVKAGSLQGYVTMLSEAEDAQQILRYAEKYYLTINDPVNQRR